jgi:hypothetical protein
MALHFLIDVARLYIPSKKHNITFFVMDQLMHILVLASVAVWYQDLTVTFGFLQEPIFLIYITGIIFITLPASVIVRVMVSRWYQETENSQDDSLQDAGTYIGILERIFILVFVLTGRWEGIGFLIAAKSIFRFADIKGNPDRKLTEYFLIGTLLSFATALFTGLIMNWLINNYQV